MQLQVYHSPCRPGPVLAAVLVAAATAALVSSDARATAARGMVDTTPAAIEPVTTTAAGAQRLPLDQLEIVTAGHPKAFFFRTVVAQGAKTLDQDEFVAAFSQLNGAMGASKNFLDPTSPTRENQYLTALKAAYPGQMVSLMASGQGRNPIAMPLDYAGHWLYFAGTRLTGDIGPGTTILPVEDPSLFKTGIGRFGTSTDDMVLCRVDAAGHPDWTSAEHLSLVRVNEADGTIEVKRGLLGSPSTDFPAGSYIAPHGAEGPWGSATAQRAWFPNFATIYPGDPAQGGATYGQVYVDEITRLFGPGGSLAAYDGIQFDVLVWKPGSRDAAGRSWDADGDGAADDLLIDGDNVYGVGVTDFTRRLRRQPVMAERFITADGHSPNNQRSIHVLNGVESEGFPSVGDLDMLDWSGGVNRMRFWNESRGHAPRLSYVMFKTGESDKPAVHVPPGLIRLTLAAGPLLDSAVTFFNPPPPEAGEAVGIWDELIKGREKEKNWLGQAVGDTVDLAEGTPDLLEGAGRALAPDFVDRWSVSPPGAGTIEGHHHGEYGWALKLAPDPTAVARGVNPVFTFTPDEAAPVVVKSGDLVAYFDVWADPHPGYPARQIGVLLPERRHPERSRARVTTWADGVPFRAMAFWRDPGPTSVRLQFVIDHAEGSEAFYLQNLELHNAVPALVRRFEGGAVLANPSLNEYVFHLAPLLPGMRLRTLVGSSNQDPANNTGQSMVGGIIMPGLNALFLAAEPPGTVAYLPRAVWTR